MEMNDVKKGRMTTLALLCMASLFVRVGSGLLYKEKVSVSLFHLHSFYLHICRRLRGSNDHHQKSCNENKHQSRKRMALSVIITEGNSCTIYSLSLSVVSSSF